MWPFSSNSTPPNQQQEQKQQQILAQQRQEQPWYRENTTDVGPRSRHRDQLPSTDTNVMESFDWGYNDNKPTSTSLKNQQRQNSNFYNDESIINQQQIELDRQNDIYFDNDGRFNPIAQTPTTNNNSNDDQYQKYDSTQNDQFQQSRGQFARGPQAFKRKQITTPIQNNNNDNDTSFFNNDSHSTQSKNIFTRNGELSSEFDALVQEKLDEKRKIEVNKKWIEVQNEKLSKEKADDEALWAQKDRLRLQQRQLLNGNNNNNDNDVFEPNEYYHVGSKDPRQDPTAPYDDRGKRLFRKFDIAKALEDKNQLGSLYSTDIDGLPTNSLSFGQFTGIPDEKFVQEQVRLENRRKYIHEYRLQHNGNDPPDYNEEQDGHLFQPRVQTKEQQKQSQQQSQQSQQQQFISNRPRSHVKQKLPANVTKDGQKFHVVPPQSITPEAFQKLSPFEQEQYQTQLLDYQKYSFRHLNTQQRELMLLAQWEKLSPVQQDECREFQYLHLNFNTRKRVKHMSRQDREDFLRGKHLDQQKIFLLQPLSFELNSQDEFVEAQQFARDDDEIDYYLEGNVANPRAQNMYTSSIDKIKQIRLENNQKKQKQQKKNQTNTKQRKTNGKYDQYIRKPGMENNNDDDIDDDGIDNDESEFDGNGEKKKTWQDIVQKYKNNNNMPTSEELEIIQEQLRNLTPQQQFNVLFRQHEKQLKELGRFHDAQLKKATEMRVKQLEHEFYEQLDKESKSGKNKSHKQQVFDPMEHYERIIREPMFVKLKKRQEKQRKELMDKQDAEHQSLSQVLLNQERIRRENERIQSHNDQNRLLDTNKNDEIDLELSKLSQYNTQSTYKSTGKPLEDEIAAKKRELLRRRQEQELQRKLEEERMDFLRTEEELKIQYERERVAQILEDSRAERERDFMILETRNKMYNVGLPIRMSLYKPRHPYLNANNRKRDERAAYMYKTLGMFLFGVNVRWNGGIFNGLLSTMVPANDINKNTQNTKGGGYYVDIENRYLDFTNLYNYYGVAAALYQPSIMPSFSHALYEDPTVFDPMTNPNVIGFASYQARIDSKLALSNEANGDNNNNNNNNNSDTATTTTTSNFNIPLPSSSQQPPELIPGQKYTPSELEQIQQAKIKSYQSKLANSYKIEKSVFDDPSTLQPVIFDPSHVQNFENSITGDVNNQLQPSSQQYDINSDDMDSIVASMLRFQHETRQQQNHLDSVVNHYQQQQQYINTLNNNGRNINKTPEQLRAELNSLLPNTNLQFIDDKTTTQSISTATNKQIEADLLSKARSGEYTPRQLYEMIVYNNTLSDNDKKQLYSQLQKFQQEQQLSILRENGSHLTDNDENDNNMYGGKLTNDELRQRKESMLGKKLSQFNSNDNNVRISSFQRLNDIGLDSKVVDLKQFEEHGHPILTQVLEERLYNPNGLPSFDFDNNNQNNNQNNSLFGTDKDFFEAHNKWDLTDNDDISYNNNNNGFGRLNSNNWSSQQQQQSQSRSNQTQQQQKLINNNNPWYLDNDTTPIPINRRHDAWAEAYQLKQDEKSKLENNNNQFRSQFKQNQQEEINTRRQQYKLDYDPITNPIKFEKFQPPISADDLNLDSLDQSYLLQQLGLKSSNESDNTDIGEHQQQQQQQNGNSGWLSRLFG